MADGLLARDVTRWRRVTGLFVALLLPSVVCAVLVGLGPQVQLPSAGLSFVLVVVVTALVGGLVPALLSAVLSSVLLNYWFIPPVRTFRVAESHNVYTLLVFLLVATLVGAVVHRAAAMTARAQRAAAESRTLSAIAGATMDGQDALPTMVEELRRSFGMASASLLRERPADEGGGWLTLESAGPAPALVPDDAEVAVPAGRGLVLAMSGRSLTAADRRVLNVFATQVQGLVERDRLGRAAAEADRLAAADSLRNALLAAVGHDLRTPLASATAAVSSLRSPDVAYSPEEREQLLATAEESLRRLARLVADVLDLSRLRSGVLRVERVPVWVDDVVSPALDELGSPAPVRLDLPDDLPPALGDPVLVTRALANVLGNALVHGASAEPPAVVARARDDRVEVAVVDHGRGVGARDPESLFIPFQRLGDTDNSAGLGLGLALSRGLVEAMDGTLRAEPTPGGGLTVTVSLPRAAS